MDAFGNGDRGRDDMSVMVIGQVQSQSHVLLSNSGPGKSRPYIPIYSIVISIYSNRSYISLKPRLNHQSVLKAWQR